MAYECCPMYIAQASPSLPVGISLIDDIQEVGVVLGACITNTT